MPNAAIESLSALFQFELCPQAAVSVAFADGQHVRMQIGLWALLGNLHPGQCKAQTPPAIPARLRGSAGNFGIEGAYDLSADLL